MSAAGGIVVIFGIVVLCGFCGMIGFLFLTAGLVGAAFRKDIIFKVMIGVSVLFLMVPVVFGMLTAGSFYEDLQYESQINQEEKEYKEEYPVSWKFEYECEYGENHEKLKELIEEYPDDINQVNGDGYTIFDELIVYDCYDSENLKLLLNAGAKRSEMSLETDGGTLFLVTLAEFTEESDKEDIREQCQCIQILLDHGEDINQREALFQHATPLMAASGYFDKEDEYDVREEDPWTPSKKVIQYLLDAGADPKIKDDMGKTAEDYYKFRSQPN